MPLANPKGERQGWQRIKMTCTFSDIPNKERHTGNGFIKLPHKPTSFLESVSLSRYVSQLL